jgi:hypothetical protein
MSVGSADDVYGNTIHYIIVLALIVLFITLSLASYSSDDYTLTKYPGLAGNAIVCVEGEVDPTNQTITVINLGETHTVNPYVTINGVRHAYNMSVSDLGVRQKTQSLRLGCNNITYGAASDTKFKVRVEYLSHWRPVVKYLEIGNLRVGHSTRYFISTADADKHPIVKSKLNITDITRDIASQVFDVEFNGTAVRYRMGEPGNYKASMQVYDGYVWSDVYEVGFTSHVITTEEQKKAYRAYVLDDDPVLRHGGFIPTEIKPDDNKAFVSFKRGVNGAYILVERIVGLTRSFLKDAGDFIKAKLPI